MIRFGSEEQAYAKISFSALGTGLEARLESSIWSSSKLNERATHSMEESLEMFKIKWFRKSAKIGTLMTLDGFLGEE